MKISPKEFGIKKIALIGVFVFVLIMFILPFAYFFVTGEFPKGYPIQAPKKVKEGAQYVCADGSIVSSPEQCPKEIITPISSAKGGIQLDLRLVEDDTRGYLANLYSDLYPILENITGGPCAPFKANVIYTPSGGGGEFKSSGIGQDATILFNMPIQKYGKAYDPNFDSRFGHEFTHGFLNGVRTIDEIPSTISFIDEGSTEMIVQMALLELIKKGEKDYVANNYYLPLVVASYDSFVIQGKDVAGGTQTWKNDPLNLYYKEAEAVWYFLEQAKPGYTKELFKKICSMPQTKEAGISVIYLKYSQFKDMTKEIFGDTKIEGKSVLEWLEDQPVTNIHGEPGKYIRVLFTNSHELHLGRSGFFDVYLEQKAINPGGLIIAAIERTKDPHWGVKDTQINTNPSVKIIDWQGNVRDLEIISGDYPSADIPTLPPGAYKAEVSDESLNAKTTTYFVITDAIDENSIYGIKLANGEIISTGTVKSSLGDAKINNGVFIIKVPANVREVTFPETGRTAIKPAQMARMVII